MVARWYVTMSCAVMEQAGGVWGGGGGGGVVGGGGGGGGGGGVWGGETEPCVPKRMSVPEMRYRDAEAFLHSRPFEGNDRHRCRKCLFSEVEAVFTSIHSDRSCGLRHPRSTNMGELVAAHRPEAGTALGADD